uniref:Uncharacterized protein n=1 Tax=Salix viminalis TaxID=40686 RepID=A0A6N2N4T9_SALVM
MEQAQKSRMPLSGGSVCSFQIPNDSVSELIRLASFSILSNTRLLAYLAPVRTYGIENLSSMHLCNDR